MSVSSWSAWGLDAPTWAWVAWWVWFFCWEAWAIMSGQPSHTLTFHLRPLFIEHPVTWFLAFGLWMWLGVHMLTPSLEQWLIEVVRSRA